MPQQDVTGPRVLVADDEVAMCVALGAALRENGFGVDCVHSGPDAVARLAAAGYAAAIIDLWLPGLDGLQVLKAARAQHPGMPLVAISGGGPRLSLEAAHRLAEVCGADQVFIKPFDDEALVRRLKDLLAPPQEETAS